MNETFKRVDFKIFAPGNRKFVRVIYRSRSGMSYTEAQVHEILATVMAEVTKQFDGQDSGYRIVPLGRGCFNVVHGIGQA